MAAELPAIMVHSILEIVRGISYEGDNIEIKEICPHNWKNANLSLDTGVGFSYCVHLIIKPRTWRFWVIICFSSDYEQRRGGA